MNLSFVIPVYNEHQSLELLLDEILEQTKDDSFEIIFVDDGSTDGSGETLQALTAKHKDVHVTQLPAHQGKTAALAAGFKAAQGDVVFTLDSDLQDNPEDIPLFLEKLSEGYDLVCGWKTKRRDPLHKVYLSKLYNRTVASIFSLEIHDVNCGFKAMRNEVVKSLVLTADLHRLIPVLAQQQGCRVGEVPVHHRARQYGRSKYGPMRYMKGLRDVLTLWWRTPIPHRSPHD